MAAAELVQWIAQDVTSGALENLSFDQASLKVKPAARRFIVTEKISDDCIRLIEDNYKDTSLWPGLLVLRGLLARGILVYVLKERRFHVEYGHSPKRMMLAVPFRAKDMPSLRAEFGRPDVAITLTCLSYYYTGLTQQDNPTLEYESWVLGLQFYLSRVVFPKEAKAFPDKLTCSGWDLAQEKSHLTTSYHSFCAQRTIAIDASVKRWLAHELAEAWLQAKHDAQGAVFVNEDDELVVVSRHGTVGPLRSSPFAQQLDRCIVYLDDAHTRGIDVKLPPGL
ncbi:hypothetical protein M405DRAFT_836440 [Rhizopogon salebrosus TDB-379]|nr:hypothetical protein M405DRAFT_836440 [Rhizopogon salebrosus TDB-379]